MDKRFLAIILLSLSIPTFAGPPFLTDDPETLQQGTWEDLLYAFMTRTQQQSVITAPGIELNYGVTDNFKLSGVVSWAKSTQTGGESGSGLSDVQVGFAYKFIQETPSTPQVSFVPNMTFPTGNVKKILGNGRPTYLFPIWAQKSFGPWTIYGGGGYAINHAPTMCNYYLGGLVIQNDLNEQWTLGGEIYTLSRTSTTTPATTLLNFGGFYNITKHLAVMFSTGHSIKGVTTYIAYLGLDYYLDLSLRT